VEQEKPVEVEKPVEAVKTPDPVDKPVETPEKVEQARIVTDEPEVLSTTQPSDFQIEAAERQILEDTKIEPLPDTVPPIVVKPVEEKKVEPEKTLARPLPHPISRARVVLKVAEVKPVEKKPVEVKPVEKLVEKPVVKKDEPKPVGKKPVEKKPEPKKEKAKKEVKKKTVAREGNADLDSTKGRDTAKKKDGTSQDASRGNSKNKLKGNAAKTNYKGLVQRKLERARKRVPVSGKGKVIVVFTITANGSVINLQIRQSSGKPALDKAALDIVRKASPFPAIPADTGMTSYSPNVPMTFKGK
jgi:protein TonB